MRATSLQLSAPIFKSVSVTSVVFFYFSLQTFYFASSAARDHDTAALGEATEKLIASNEQLRRAKEERASLEHEVKLLKQQDPRADAKSNTSPNQDGLRDERVRELNRKIEYLSANLAERSQEHVALRRETEKLTREDEALRAPKEIPNNTPEDLEEDLTIEGNQPVRLIEFPKDFAQTLAQFPPHAGRAVMKRIGLIAAGEKAGFDEIKHLKAYPGVLRARISDKFRLFFTLTPDRVQIVDLIWRDDLDRWVKQLLARGLPL